MESNPKDLKRIEELEAKLSIYEQNGAAKLYYALNRKQNEMADLMNSISLKNLDITDPKDKSFERLKVLWNDAASIATATEVLGKSAGVTGNEQDDINKKPFVETLAQPRR
jgi:hypothetical protein